MRAILAPRRTLLIGALALAATFIASRGPHSEVHEFVAMVAMVLEGALIVCSSLGWRRATAVLLVGVVVCWLAAFFTDGFCLNAYRNFRQWLGSW
jgi:hypothetical protein